MFRRSLLTVAVVLSLASVVYAQGDANPPDPNNNAANNGAGNQGGSQPTNAQDLQQQISDLTQRVTNLETAIADLPQMARSLETISTQLQAIDAGGIQEILNQVAEMQVVLADITKQSATGHMLDLSGKMESDGAFREQMRRVTQGKIMFNNMTGIPQLVYVNGTPWNVRPGVSYIMTQIGDVSTQMAYFDAAATMYNHWQLVDGEYQLPIDIR